MFNWFKRKPEIVEYQRPVVSIRLEAIGGQGANSAGKIIAEAAVLGKGYTGNHFSSFGSEKGGTPEYRDWETDRKSTRLNSSH